MISRRCAYWVSLLGMKETSNTSKISVRLPRSQQFNVEQLREKCEVSSATMSSRTNTF